MAKKQTAVAPAPQTTEAALREKFKDYPALNLLERRLADPRDPGSLPILLKDEPDPHCGNTDHWFKHTDAIARGRQLCPSCRKPFRTWYLRWITAGEEGRWSSMKAKGYIPVTVDELPDEDAVAALHKSERDNYVRRGDRGQDILARMPLPFFLEIQRRELALRKTNQTARKITDALANDAGKELGSEAGDVLEAGLRVFKDKQHRTTLADELGASVEN